MVYSSIPLAQAVITLCLRKGIDHVVISPGSRNAPLTIGFSHHPEIKAYSIVDERCAAFFALGLSQQLQRPVALCCTSGSALLNYYPAIAEAFYSDIPLVVLSADRPIERIDIGDGQTIRQRDVYKNHILYSANLYSELVPAEVSTDEKLRQKQRETTTHNQQEVNKALNTAIEQNGPVHVNIPFYEPLYTLTTEAQPAPIIVDPKIKKEELSAGELHPFAKTWNAAKKKIVLVGVLPPDAVERGLLEILAHDPSVLVFTETTSNLHHPNFFTRTDNLIGSLDTEGFKRLQPDLLVTFGGMVISKKVKAFLRNYQPEQHWHIDSKKAYDTYFCLNRHFEVAPNAFWKRFLPLTEFQESDYFDIWNTVKLHRDQKHEEYLKEMQWCDFKAFQMVLGQIPTDSMLQLGNSSTVRYVQLFDVDKSLKVYCNRGTSGIDGSTSTAIGAAVGSQLPTTLIAGDLSFFYDSNALWNKYVPKNFKIIVINNGGGGIFRILPGNKDTDEFTDFFETTHELSARHLAEMYDFAYYHAENSTELKSRLIPFYTENEKPSILEISTPRTINDQVLLNYFQFIR